MAVLAKKANEVPLAAIAFWVAELIHDEEMTLPPAAAERLLYIGAALWPKSIALGEKTGRTSRFSGSPDGRMGTPMGTHLDDILAQVDCPRCGAEISAPYSQIRLYKAAGCACGTLIRLEDDTPIAAIQALIDEANPTVAEID
jgi:hypothetical protein